MIHFFFAALRKRSLGELRGVVTYFGFFWWRGRLMEGVAWVALVRLGSGSTGSIVPPEVAPRHLLVAEGDLTGSYGGTAGVDLAVAASSAVISAMMLSKFFLAASVWVTRSAAALNCASISLDSFSDSSSWKIFSLPLTNRIGIGGSS